MNILVTGGTGGLGRAIVERFAQKEDNQIYFTYSTSIRVAEDIESQHDNVVKSLCDFTDRDCLNDFLCKMDNFDLDVLVNNAWVGKPEAIRAHKITNEQIMNSFECNVLPTIAITQKAIQTFKKKRRGHIITVLTSYVVGVPPIGYGIYASTKAYLSQMAKSWSSEYGRFGIASNCVSPEFMQTDFTKGTDSRVIEQMTAQHPFNKLLEPSEVADVIISLAYFSPQVNGVNIPINAGTNIL